MTDRQKLVKDLENYFDVDAIEKGSTLDMLAEFVLSDRRRIVEPLVKCNATKCDTVAQALAEYVNATDETLKRAGEL
jgi:hypothetical protein